MKILFFHHLKNEKWNILLGTFHPTSGQALTRTVASEFSVQRAYQLHHLPNMCYYYCIFKSHKFCIKIAYMQNHYLIRYPQPICTPTPTEGPTPLKSVPNPIYGPALMFQPNRLRGFTIVHLCVTL